MVRRRQVDAREIEAFGLKADSVIPTPGLSVGDESLQSAKKANAPESMVLYFRGDTETPRRIASLAEREDRSKHKIAMKALQLGLEQIEKSGM